MDTQGKTMEHGKILTLDDLQLISSEGGFRPSGAVADAVTALAGDVSRPLEIPSLMQLSGFYGCSYLDVYDALRILKGRGFEYRLRGIDNPISLWRA